MDVTCKTILITGSSEGIGAECARLFSKSGANLVLVARTKSKLEEIAEEIRNDCKVLLVPMDISATRSCKKLISKTVSEFGSLDILINNAGMHERGDFCNLSVDDIGKMVDVNLRAPMILSSMALPHMRSAGSGSIVMIASLAGMSPLQGAAIYSSTKAGLRHLALHYMMSSKMQIFILEWSRPDQFRQVLYSNLSMMLKILFSHNQ